MIIGAIIVCLLLAALAFGLMFCMFWLMFAEIAGGALSSAKKKDHHAP